MKLLFYDLEFATSRGGVSIICEFGFVVTDEKFNILDRGNYIINPNIERSEWDYTVVRKILTRDVKDYEFSPLFVKYYKQIRQFFDDADFVFGHSVSGDARALNDNCKRYNLDSIDHSFYDVKILYKKLAEVPKEPSVVSLLELLGIQGEENIHNAETDAYNTMLILEGLLKTYNVRLEELGEKFPDLMDQSKDFEIKSIKDAQIRKEEKRRQRLNIKKAAKRAEKAGATNVTLYDSTEGENPEPVSTLADLLKDISNQLPEE